MADSDLTRRLRDQLLKYDTLDGGPPAKGFILLADVRAAADRIDHLEQQLAEREREVVMALEMHEVQYLRAERAESRLAALHTAIGDPDDLLQRARDAEWGTAGPLAAAHWRRIAAAVEHTQEGT